MSSERESVTTNLVEPLVLDDLRRIVAATTEWSPVTIIRVERPDHTEPKRGRTMLTAIRGRLAAHRKRDLA